MSEFIQRPYLTKGEDCIGRVYFLRAPNSDIWVSSYDLPEETCREMWRLLKAGHYKDEITWLARGAL